METYIVVEDPKRWNLKVPGAEVVKARDYLSGERFSESRKAKVLNCCYYYSYNSIGYYVSLVAAARGHYPMPSIKAIQDMRLDVVIRRASHEIDAQIQRSLKGARGDVFELSIYFGKNVARCYNTLAQMLYNLFPLPFFRAYFVRKDNAWRLDDVRVIAARDIPEHHHPFVMEQIVRFMGKTIRTSKGGIQPYRYEMAILRSKDDPTPPSNPEAIRKFCRAAEKNGVGVELITRNDFAQLDRYDALFIRDTTGIDHYTYRFARRAESVGLAVIDDPLSILRCTNKIYLAELMRRCGIPTPTSFIINKHNAGKVKEIIGFPCVVKIPDSSFSLGVYKFDSQDAFHAALPKLFKQSDLLLAQKFTPTEFDWRVGIINRQALFVCRYYMAEKHWKIYNHEHENGTDCGMADTLAVGDAPRKIVDTALRASGMIGNGFYGVDLKEINGEPCVIEINDNPSIDAGIEDEVLKDDLYNMIIREFIRRLDRCHGKP